MRRKLYSPVPRRLSTKFRKMPKTVLKLEEYEILLTIGTGSFGTCRKVRRKTDGKVFVWKEIDYGGMTEKEKQLLVQEVNLLRELRHQHIVRYLDRIIDRSEATLYIIMEFCEGGDLAAFIGRCKTERRYVEESFVWKVFYQVLLALEECHKKRSGVHKVLHRDLKPANVFLDASHNVKLGDFGLARILHHNFSLAKTFVGTPYYMSPEQLKEQAYDEKSDLWSLGCLIYELCALVPPFNAPNQKVLTVKVKAGRFRRIPSHYSDELQRAITSLLQVEPEKRPVISLLLPMVSQHVVIAQRKPSREGTRTRDEKELGLGECAVRKLTASELAQWEAELMKKENGLKAKERALQERESLVAAREKSVKEMAECLNEHEKEKTKMCIHAQQYCTRN